MPQAFYIAVIGFTLLLLVVTLYMAFLSDLSQIFWRQVKFCASFAALIGLVGTMFTVDILTRDVFRVGGEREARDELLELRFKVVEYMSDHCPAGAIPAEDKNSCFDFHNIAQQLSLFGLKQQGKIKAINNWQRNSVLERPIKDINERISRINYYWPEPAIKTSFFSDDFKVIFALISVLLLSLSVCGTIGEAAYQLRQAVRAN